MSFSSQVKDKLCEAGFVCPKCALYETAGALLFGGSVSEDRMRFSTENARVAQRVADDIKEAFGIDALIKESAKSRRIEIDDKFSAENIHGAVMTMGEMPFACCRGAFARGAFLGGGSVTDPVKGYHLEFGTKMPDSASMLKKLLSADGVGAKITSRKGYHILYLKGSEKIAELLGLMGAAQPALELYTIQIEKDMRNSVNRRVNCENANANKAAIASSKHLHAIRKIKKANKWGKLPDVLKEIGTLREEYPEDSIKELGEKTNPPIGKSGVNHRLNRILEFADGISTQQ